MIEHHGMRRAPFPRVPSERSTARTNVLEANTPNRCRNNRKGGLPAGAGAAPASGDGWEPQGAQLAPAVLAAGFWLRLHIVNRYKLPIAHRTRAQGPRGGASTPDRFQSEAGAEKGVGPPIRQPHTAASGLGTPRLIVGHQTTAGRTNQSNVQ